jgi:AraC-like DNA-binding protein
MTREGYSRRFRRLYGVAPDTFRLLSQLNLARGLLRQGAPIASVAAEAGFSDQSHLGRCFRRTFGVTPGRYRIEGHIRSRT